MNDKQIKDFVESAHLLNWKELHVTESIRSWFESSPDFLQQLELGESKVNAYTFQYCSNDHLVQGFYAEPKGNNNKLPCIIFNRGGTADFGELKIGHFFTGIISSLVQNGYCVFASQYSGAGLSEGRDEFGGRDVEDVLSLYKIIQNNPLVDIHRIGVYGSSRGGMMNYLLLAQVEWIRAVVSVGAMVDLVSVETFRPEAKNHFEKIFGGSTDEKIKRSALYWTEKFPKTVPVLMIHGSADWRVDPRDSLRLAEKFQEHKIPYRLAVFEGADHQLNEFREDVDDLTVEWFDRFVKKTGNLPNMKPHGK